VQPPPAAPADPPPPPDPIAPIRADVESLLAAQGEILWRAWKGAEDGDRGAPLAARERLLSPEALETVGAALSKAAGDERRALQLLQGYLLGERLGRDSAAAGERLSAARSQAAITWEGRELAARRAPVLLAAEPDARRRAAIEKALAQSAARLSPLEADFRRALDAAARGAGRSGALAAASELRGEEVPRLAARAEAVLEATAAPYRALMEDLARRELSLPFDRLRGRDLPRLFALAQDPRAFPAGPAAERALSTLRGLGIDLAARPGVLLDLAARAGKDPRTLLLPVEVPGGVRVSAVPSAGAAEARAILRALGGAAYHSGIKAEGVEFRRLGAVTPDAWSTLFEELSGEAGWLAQHTGLSEHLVEPIVRAAAARRLHAAREAAARLLLELPPGPLPERARALAERAFARPVEAEEALLLAAEPDPLLRSADALAAMLIAAQAEAYLARLAGPTWWREEKAGAFLRAAFAEGTRLAPADLSRALGFADLDADALVQVVRAHAERAGVNF